MKINLCKKRKHSTSGKVKKRKNNNKKYKKKEKNNKNVGLLTTIFNKNRCLCLNINFNDDWS